jgi:hypothetical protein
MKLHELVLQNVRGVPDGRYSFADARTGAPLDVALVTGGPGSGKTSLLEAIAAAKEAVGSYGAPIEPKRILRRGAVRGRVETTWVLSEAEQARTGLGAQHAVDWELGEEPSRAEADPALRRLFATYSRDPAQGKVEYFPANRTLSEPEHAPLASDASEARLRLGKDPGKYGGLMQRLRALALEDAARVVDAADTRGIVLRKDVPDVLAPYREAISALLPHLRLDRVDLGPGNGAVRFLRRDRLPVELSDLSESERQGVLFALAFQGLGLSRSLVLIDEPELHVHASDRVRFLQALVSLGRDNQLVIATGSAEIAAAAAPGQIIDLSARAGGGAS